MNCFKGAGKGAGQSVGFRGLAAMPGSDWLASNVLNAVDGVGGEVIHDIDKAHAHQAFRALDQHGRGVAGLGFFQKRNHLVKHLQGILAGADLATHGTTGQPRRARGSGVVTLRFVWYFGFRVRS